jgi:glutathione S-transferase
VADAAVLAIPPTATPHQVFQQRPQHWISAIDLIQQLGRFPQRSQRHKSCGKRAAQRPLPTPPDGWLDSEQGGWKTLFFGSMALTLYGAPRSRAALVRWYLEEKGIPCASVTIDLAAGEQHGAPFLAINPFGKVPALVDDAFALNDGQPLALFESGSILMHLAEHHARESASPVWRSLTAQWVLYANATLGPAMFLASSRPQEIQRQLAALDPLLANGRSLLASIGGAPAWGAADCAVQGYLAYLPLFCKELDLAPYPAVQASIAATTAREAYKTAMGLS